jgi:pantoate--beta-alanine ligase
MYPESQETWVNVEKLTVPLCGRNRPGHFQGVATVVAKLFNLVNPDLAVFGQKDAQQALVIRRMVQQLGFPVRLVLAPIVREPDGLAVSSRNRYLSDENRRLAAGLNHGLNQGRKTIEAGERDPDAVTRTVRTDLNRSGINGVEYVEALSADDLSSISPLRGKIIIALAARLGNTRLIDNLVLQLEDGGRVTETMLF